MKKRWIWLAAVLIIATWLLPSPLSNGRQKNSASETTLSTRQVVSAVMDQDAATQAPTKVTTPEPSPTPTKTTASITTERPTAAPIPTVRPTATPKPEPTPEPEPEPIPVQTSYILNKNTHKFHYPYCPSVGQMKESNKLFFDGSREETIAMGYEPCGRCRP